jgi:type II secretory pathway component PulJ
VKYAISILQAGVTALTRINVKDGRIEELKRAIAILEKNG